MTEFTQDCYVCGCTGLCGGVCPNPKLVSLSIDHEAVLARIAALGAKTAEVQRIPLYAMLDVFHAVTGTSHPEWDRFYEEHGYAESWARIIAMVRDVVRERDALATADAVVTVEQIEGVVQAEIVAAVGECICHEAYTSRNKRDPDCGWHWVGDDFASDTAKVIQRLYRGEAGAVQCDQHKPVQHRDGKPPWCRACGKTAAKTAPGSRFRGEAGV